jgi:hypothetical protein
LTEWAPEPRDVYWDNLSIPFVSLTVRRLIVAVAFFFLNFFYVIPIAFVQSLANLEGIEKAAPFLKPLIEEYVYFNMSYLLHIFFYFNMPYFNMLGTKRLCCCVVLPQ